MDEEPDNDLLLGICLAHVVSNLEELLHRDVCRPVAQSGCKAVLVQGHRDKRAAVGRLETLQTLRPQGFKAYNPKQASLVF